MGAVLTEGIEILTSGIVPYAQAFGGGLKALAESIFIDVGTDGANTLGIIGGMAFLFGGISLAVGATRWFLNWVTSLGARNR